MKRVMVVGGPGSGKSTLAVKLGEITGLPVYHMDKIHWSPDWVEREQSEKIRRVKEIEAKDRWILEGGLSVTSDSRASFADTVIWLDLPLPLRVGRILRRRVQFHGKARPDLPAGCIERLDPEFLVYIVKTRNTDRQKIAQAIADAPHLDVHHICTAKGANTLLEWLRDDFQNHR